MFKLPVVVATVMLATSAFAESHSTTDVAISASGDAAAGETAFNRQCITCHVVENEAGEILAGRKARSGPNLYGVAGRTLGTVPDFRYGKSIVQAGESGMIWTEENFVAYAQDPTKWLRAALDDSKARSKMALRVRSEEDATDIFAFLMSLKPNM